MAWRIYAFLAEKREAVEEVLKDDVLWRQTRIFREATTLGGKGGEYYLYLEGAESAMERADKLMPLLLATRLDTKVAESVHARLKEEEERSAEGMGLIFGGEEGV